MQLHLSTEGPKVAGPPRYLPEVSIILPFEPVISSKSELQQRLKKTVERVESELKANYSDDKATPVLIKLKNLVQSLNFYTRRSALAIFVSPTMGKVYYLDLPVNEKIIIDESFEIRDLIYSKQQLNHYLLLGLSGGSSKIYLGNCSSLILLKSNVPQTIHAYERDMPEKSGSFFDPNNHQEILLGNFLRHLDHGLSSILDAYPLPVFVLGPEKVLERFKRISRNEKSLVRFIVGDHEGASETEIRELMKPYIEDWRKLKEQAILLQIHQAVHGNKLEYGIKKVWQMATQKNCRLLLVENDFMYPAHHGPQLDNIRGEDLTQSNPYFLKDAVDEVMEKVLAAGGDVEFVSNDALKEYGRVALIRLY
ncbi:MAG TPA: hypothetical protein VL727_17525 [Puia sp.]|jgi:hypothetical protein|nr:hypothetical protein [Puia sp.]